MLYLPKHRLDSIEKIRASLLGAVQLELATLPLYLTSLYSIKPGMNVEIAAILKHVAMEEMLHFCLACNILNAVGGQCAIAVSKFAPHYPAPLPMNIGTQRGKPFIVSLKKFSLEHVQQTFMVVEEPEEPLDFEGQKTPPHARPNHHTIGEFYEALAKEIARRGKSIFTGHRKMQVTGWFDGDELFAVTGPESAARAFKIIEEQGEGTKTTPVDLEHRLSHYYRFAEIVNGRRLVRNHKAPNGWSYAGEKIPFDPAGVYPMADDPGEADLPASCSATVFADRFDATYSTLLNALHVTFNGKPHFESAVGVMYTLRILAQQLMEMPIPGRKVTAGPRWRYVPSTSIA